MQKKFSTFTRRTGFSLGLALVLLLLLTGCTADLATPAEDAQASGDVSAIPTFTPFPSTPFPTLTVTPTPIVVPPSDTPAPTPTPVPTATPTVAATRTNVPTRAVTPLPTLNASGEYVDISADQARNLNGYRTLLPTYLPAGFKLARITYSKFNNSPVFSLLVAFENDQNQSFYLNIQYVPPQPTPTPTETPGEVPLVTFAPVEFATPTLPPIRTQPYPTASGGDFVQYDVQVRKTAGLLSYSSTFTSLSWSEASGNYALNGNISPDEALKVAASLN